MRQERPKQFGELELPIDVASNACMCAKRRASGTALRLFTTNSESGRHTPSPQAARHALQASSRPGSLQTKAPPSVPNFARTRLKVASAAGVRSSDRNIHEAVVVTSLKVQAFPIGARTTRSSALRVCKMCPPLRLHKRQTRSSVATMSEHIAQDCSLNMTPVCRPDGPSPYLGAPVLLHPLSTPCPLAFLSPTPFTLTYPGPAPVPVPIPILDPASTPVPASIPAPATVPAPSPDSAPLATPDSPPHLNRTPTSTLNILSLPPPLLIPCRSSPLPSSLTFFPIIPPIAEIRFGGGSP